MFTDVVGSTSATARSERDDLALRERHREVVQRFVARYGGRIVESPGDETLSVFESALAAADAGLAIQAAVHEQPDLRLTIGLHLGVLRGREVFGDAIDLAARIRGLVGAGDILDSPPRTAHPRAHERARSRSSTRRIFPLTVLGSSGTNSIWRGYL
jgi:adenylate cyclase